MIEPKRQHCRHLLTRSMKIDRDKVQIHWHLLGLQAGAAMPVSVSNEEEFLVNIFSVRSERGNKLRISIAASGSRNRALPLLIRGLGRMPLSV